jgi:hypothetical protein
MAISVLAASGSSKNAAQAAASRASNSGATPWPVT